MKLGTHNGIFQADDVFAAAILNLIYPDAEIVRTRDQAVLDTCDIVFDVGAVFDPDKLRFDHHQRTCSEVRPNGVKYSSAGMVWRHFGRRMCSEEVVESVDRSLFQHIDALDNGQEISSGDAIGGVFTRSATLSNAISAFNPAWHEEDKDYDAAFLVARHFAEQILRRKIKSAEGTVIAKALASDALRSRGTERRIAVMETFHPWQEVFCQDKDVLLAVYPSETGEWMIQCVPPEAGSFEKRMPLPEKWAGLRAEELSDLIEIPGAIFCHAGRFIMGHKAREGAIEMAKLAIALSV